jgi:predicted permease
MQGGRKEKGFKLKDLINPGIVSLVVGFLMFLFSIKLPAPVSNAISLVGSTTTPMSMVLIGIILAEESIVRAFTDIKVFAMSFVRLIVVPFISLLVLKQFVNNPLVLGVPVMVAAMPAGTVTAMFAEKYGTDTYAASQSIFISTLFSIVTIPIMVYIIGTM